jgi:hypothetical protein
MPEKVFPLLIYKYNSQSEWKYLDWRVYSIEVSFTNRDLTHAYFSSNAVAISEQLINTALLTRETSGERMSVIDSTYHINKGILCPTNDYVHHISKVIINSLAKQ